MSDVAVELKGLTKVYGEGALAFQAALRRGDQPIANLLVNSAMAHGLRQAFAASLSEVRLGTFRPESQD